MDDDEIIVCRCEDLTLGRLREMIREGLTSLVEIKMACRAGMGPCQGTTCSQIIAREIAAATGRSLGQVYQPSHRPPVGGIKLGEVNSGRDEG